MHFVLFILLFLTGCGEVSNSHSINLSFNGLHYTKSVTTWKDIQDQNIIMQQYDFSCGAASLATLMKYYFKDNITEKEILEDILKRLSEKDSKERKKTGLSLLDLKEFAERRGYFTWGGKVRLSALPKLHGPVLVYMIKNQEYQHFAILRGIKEDRVFIADPIHGNLRMTIEDFTKEWSEIVLILGKKGFGVPSEHPLAILENPPFRNELNSSRTGIYLK